MQIKNFVCISVIAVTLCSCSGNDSKKTDDEKTSPAKPITTYKPAFEGQTNIKNLTTTTTYKVDSLAGKLGCRSRSSRCASGRSSGHLAPR